MPEVIQALQYGVLGLCMIMLILTYQIILTEQRRSVPRLSIMRFAGVFMIFCSILAVINGLVQAAEFRTRASTQVEESKIDANRKLEELQGDFASLNTLLDDKMEADINSPDITGESRRRLTLKVTAMRKLLKHAADTASEK